MDWLKRLLRLGEYSEERTLGAARSGLWPRVRKTHLELNPSCAVCGTKEGCEVHHIIPVHKDKRLELDHNNLITLCEDHHLLFGHLGSFHSYNEEVGIDAKMWASRIKMRP